jgi:hypothetical protein
MTDGTTDIESLRTQRAAFLQALYEATGGTRHVAVEQKTIADELGLEEERADAIVRYLADERLLEYHTFGPTLVLTHRGITKIEGSISPETPGQPAVAIRNYMRVESMSGSTIQQGNVESQQNVVVYSGDELRDLIDVLRHALSTISNLALADESEAHAQLAELEKQAGSPHPDKTAIAKSVGALQRILQTVAISTASSAATPETQEGLEKIVHYLRVAL